MNSVFINEFTYNKKYFNEIYTYAFFRMPIVIYTNILLVMIFGKVLYDLIAKEEVYDFKIYKLLIHIGIICLVIFGEIYFIKKKIQKEYDENMKKNNEKIIKIKIKISEEEIIYDKNDTVYKFANIIKIMKTKNYYLLFFEEGFVTIKKDGFIKGTVEQFEQFLNNKMVNQ